MKNLEQELKKDEQILLKAKIQKIAFLPIIFNTLIYFAVFILLYLLYTSNFKLTNFDFKLNMVEIVILLLFSIPKFIKTIINIIQVFSIRLAFTSTRVIGRSGIINSISTSTLLNKIDNITIKSGFWGKLFGFATITISSTNNFGDQTFKYIQNAEAFKNSLLEQATKVIEDEKEKELLNVLEKANRLNK